MSCPERGQSQVRTICADEFFDSMDVLPTEVGFLYDVMIILILSLSLSLYKYIII